MHNDVVATTVMAYCEVLIEQYEGYAASTLCSTGMRSVYHRFIGELHVLKTITKAIQDALNREACPDGEGRTKPMTHFLPPDGGQLPAADAGRAGHERYMRLIAKLLELEQVRMAGTGRAYVQLQEVIAVLADEFLVEEIGE